MYHGINCTFIFDYQQYLRQPFSLVCSDLKGCYDRIFHLASRLALQHLGIPLLGIISMLDKIQRMSHTVRTAYRDYNITYEKHTIPNEFRYFMMGLCQADASAPQIWSIISSIAFLELRTQGFDIDFVKSFMI